jgi:aryl-alcohol dehydrogenase-like predicted oxidoreductase
LILTGEIAKTQLGKTTISTTRMGLGLAALGRPGYINLGHAADLNGNYDIKMMEAHCHSILDYAWLRGIRYFDAARSYGRAEQFLASWLESRNINSSAITVGSKWGYTYTAGWKTDANVHEVKEHSVNVLKKQWQESQSFLGRWLKLYQIHSATLESGVLENKHLHIVLADIKAQGVAIGLSLSGVHQAATLQKALTITHEGQQLFDVVQATWNLLETSAGPVLKQAHKQGMGVIIKEGVANGRLTGRNEEKDFQEKKALLSGIAEMHNTTIDAVALAYILAQPWVDIVLSGAATTEQLNSNLGAFDIDNVPEISIAEDPAIYWSRRSSLHWN